MSGPKTDLLQMMITMEALLEKLGDIFEETSLKERYEYWSMHIDFIQNNINGLKNCCDLKFFTSDAPPGRHRSLPDFKMYSQGLITACEDLLISIKKASDLEEECNYEIVGNPQQLLTEIASLKALAEQVSTIMPEHHKQLLNLLEQEETNIKSRLKDLRQTYMSSPVTTNVDEMQTRLNQDLTPIETALNQLLRQQSALYPPDQIEQLRKHQQELVDFFKDSIIGISVIIVEKIIDEKERTTQLSDLQNFPKNKGEKKGMPEHHKQLLQLLTEKEKEIEENIELFQHTYLIASRMKHNPDTVGYILQDYKAIKASLVELHGQQQALCYDEDKLGLQEKQKNQIDDLDSIVIATCERLEKPAKTKGPK